VEYTANRCRAVGGIVLCDELVVLSRLVVFVQLVQIYYLNEFLRVPWIGGIAA